LRIAVYPGTFDPVTNGHIDILQRATKLFDKVIVGVAEDNYKEALFDSGERVRLVKEATRDLSGVEVESFSGLLMDYVHQRGAIAIIRGLRATSDFEYEFQLFSMNKKLDESVETVFLMSTTELSFISSSIIKQVAALGGCIRGLVPTQVEKALVSKYQKSGCK